jgi:hypothetical protein
MRTFILFYSEIPRVNHRKTEVFVMGAIALAIWLVPEVATIRSRY